MPAEAGKRVEDGVGLLRRPCPREGPAGGPAVRGDAWSRRMQTPEFLGGSFTAGLRSREAVSFASSMRSVTVFITHTETKGRKVKKLTIKQKDETLQVSGVFGDPPRGLSCFGPGGLEVLSLLVGGPVFPPGAWASGSSSTGATNPTGAKGWFG